MRLFLRPCLLLMMMTLLMIATASAQDTPAEAQPAVALAASAPQPPASAAAPVTVEPPSSAAQPIPPAAHDAPFRLHRGSREIGGWFAAGPNSFVGIGTVINRRFYELDAQFDYTIIASHTVALKWVSEAVPMALLHEPNEWYFNPSHVFTYYRAGATTYAAGLTPLGLQVNFRNGHRVQPFFDSHGGFLYFRRQEPVPYSSQFNFTFNFGTGLQIYTRGRGSLLTGYKYHHISNDNTGRMNPGVDSHEFYMGYLWRWR